MKFIILSFILFIASFFNITKVGATSLKDSIVFINWTDFKAEEQGHDGSISIRVGCYRRQQLSAPINGETEVDAIQQSAVLPPAGMANWQEGQISCTDVHGLMMMEEFGRFIQVYRNYEPVPLSQEKRVIKIGEDCNEKSYWAYLKYLPRDYYDFPHNESHKDPLGHYALYEFCY